MKLFHIIIAPLFICALLHAADPLQPRKGEVPASGLYVPVSVDGYASDKSGAGFAESHVTVANVPFDLVTKAGADNFFLKSAAWPDCRRKVLGMPLSAARSNQRRIGITRCDHRAALEPLDRERRGEVSEGTRRCLRWISRWKD